MIRRSFVLGALGISVAACNTTGSGSENSGSGQAYAFTPPPSASVRRYTETIVDNSSNSIELGYTDTVTGVESNGSYQVDVLDPSGTSVTVNGTPYFIPTEAQNLTASGQLTSETQTLAGGTSITCTYDPHGSGPDFPVKVGQTWNLDCTVTCGNNAPVSYTQNGVVSDVESVAVPAGIFNALKLQSTVTWTDAKGTTHTQTTSNWRDVATSISVKQSSTTTYAGTLPTNGYPVSRDIVMQSLSD